MLENLKLENLLVIDIETVPGAASFSDLSDEFQSLWELKEGKNRSDDVESANYYFERAGIFAEFGKIICISVGFFSNTNSVDAWQFRIKSFAGKDERTILKEFTGLLNKYFNQPQIHSLAGHNVREFDVPYLCRRMIIHGLKLPSLLDVSGKKPWEVNWIDTMLLWKFGDYKNFISLRLLSALLQIPTPKGDIDGSDVARVFYEDDDLPRIVEYCQRDVLSVARIIQKFKGITPLAEHEVVFL